MKTVKITYHCDYCKQPIDTDDDAVCVLLPGRIGYQDSLIMDPEDNVKHYHDYCMEYLLCLTASNDNKKDPEPEAEPELEKAPKSKQGRGRGPSIDIGKLRSLVAAGWKFDQIMLEDEFKNRDPSGIRRWIKKINDEAKEGRNR